MNAQELNKRAEMIINMANNGMQPQMVMQQIFGRNMNYQNQIQTAQTQLQNMSEGRPMNEFFMQALKQSGLNEKNAEGIARLLNMK
jgi:vesicle coat complex subunit